MPNTVKNTTLLSPLDLIAPYSCRGCGKLGKPICDRCKSYIIENHINICPVCKSPNSTGICNSCSKDSSVSPLPPIYTIGERSDLLAAIIHDYKYHSIRPYKQPLAIMMNHCLPEITNTTYIVPLPTIHRHIRERGLDHTYLIAKQLAKLRSNFHTQKLLLRSNNAVQVGSTAKDRITQAKSAYTLNPKITIDKTATYILLDDVWTTGASLRAATQLLQSADIEKIIIAVLAISRD